MAYKPVDTAIVVVVGPLIDNTDFKTVETAIAYDAAGMSLDWIQEKADGTTVKTDLTLTTGGNNDWVHLGNGYYSVEITAAQNNEEGVGWVGGACTGVLAFESPHYDIVPTAVYDALVKGTGRFSADVTAISGDAAAADNAESFFDGTGYAGTNNVIPTVTAVTNMVTANVTQISGDGTAADNLESAADGTGYNLGGGQVVAASVTGAVGSVTGAVGSVTGNVGGNVTGSVGSVAAGGITAASIATGAIDADSLAADAGAEIADAVWDEARAGHVGAGTFGEGVSSVQGNVTGNVAGSVASVTGAVGSVTGNVGGNVTGSVGSVAAGGITAASIATNAIDADAIAADAVTEIQTGLATASALAAVDDLVDDLETRLTATRAGYLDSLTNLDAAITSRLADADYIDPPSAAANADAVWDEAIAGHLGAGSTGAALNGATAPTAAAVADAVWDEAITDHLAGGSTGAALNAAGSAGDPWTTPLPGAYGAGTAGKIIGDNLNATVGSRATQVSVDTIDDYLDTEIAAIKAKTDNLPASPAATGDIPTAAAIRSEMDNNSVDFNSILANQVTMLVRLSATRANNLDNLDATVSSRLATAGYTAPANATIAAIDAKTTNLPPSPAATGDAMTLTAAYDAAKTAATQASVNAVDDFVDTEVSAIKAVTDKLDTAMELDGAVYRFTTNALEQSPAGGGGATAADIADAVWDEALAGHAAAGSAGQALGAAGAAADPLLNAVPGAYASGTAGWVLGRLSPGAGSVEFTYTVTNGDTLLPEVAVLVEFCTDAARTNVVWRGYTDAFGVARDTLNNKPWLNPGTYYIRLTKGSNVNLDTETVS